MKFRILYIRQILIVMFLISFYHYEGYSQGTDFNMWSRPGMFVGLSLGPSHSFINNDGILSASEPSSDTRNSFIGSVEIGYFFSKYIGLTSGIGFNSYKTQLSLETYNDTLPDMSDSENETYDWIISGMGIKELQKVGSLSIPFCINLRLPVSEKIGVHLQTGINLAVPLTKNYKSTGSFTYKGYYSKYNVTLKNLPQYGFPTDTSTETNGKLNLKPVSFGAIASAGIDFFIQDNFQILVATYYEKSLSGFSDYSSPDKFRLSSEVNKINSFMGGSSKVSAQSIGFKVTLRYYLNKL